MSLLSINADLLPKWGHRRPVPKLPNDLIINILILRRDIKREENEKFMLNRVPRPEIKQMFNATLVAIDASGQFIHDELDYYGITASHYEKYESVLPLLHEYYRDRTQDEEDFMDDAYGSYMDYYLFDGDKCEELGDTIHTFSYGDILELHGNGGCIESKFRSWHSRLAEDADDIYAYEEGSTGYPPNHPLH